jgi:GT2 family glycosyltransferase
VPNLEQRQRPAVSIVVPTYNGGRFLGVQLEALASQAFEGTFEVLIADNGSSDGSVQLAGSFIDRLNVRIIDASIKRGQTFARNAGAAAARSDLLIFLDQDDVVEDGYLDAMATALASNEAVASRIEVQKLNPGWISEARDIVQTARLPASPTPWGYGCSLGIRKDAFDRVGGFDDSLRYGGEDIDLCRRLYDHGVHLQFVPGAILHYRFPDTLSALYRQGRRYGIAQAVVDHKVPAASETFSLWRWVRGTFGAIRLTLFSLRRGRRARGLFLLGRRLGAIEGELRARMRLPAYPRSV